MPARVVARCATPRPLACHRVNVADPLSALLRTLLCTLALLALAFPALAAAAPARFETGLQDPLDPGFEDPDTAHALDIARAERVAIIRVPVAWSTVAPT